MARPYNLVRGTWLELELRAQASWRVTHRRVEARGVAVVVGPARAVVARAAGDEAVRAAGHERVAGHANSRTRRARPRPRRTRRARGRGGGAVVGLAHDEVEVAAGDEPVASAAVAAVPS